MGFGKDHRGMILREKVTLTVGGLAANSVVFHTGGIILETTSFRILKTEYFVTQSGAFAAEGDEVIIGIANGELSAAEVASSLISAGPDDRNDRVGEELAMRAVWLTGPNIKEPADPAAVTTFSAPSNSGLLMSFSLRWTFTPTEGWNWFAFNPLGGALTSGAVFFITAKHFGVWVD